MHFTGVCFSAALCALLVSCSAMNQFAGLGVLSEETSGFDNRKIIEVSGNHVMTTDKGLLASFPAAMGARWESVDPENAFITLTYSSDVRYSSAAYTNFREFAVNLEGEISRFAIAAPTSHESSNYNTVSATDRKSVV